MFQCFDNKSTTFIAIPIVTIFITSLHTIVSLSLKRIKYNEGNTVLEISLVVKEIYFKT